MVHHEWVEEAVAYFKVMYYTIILLHRQKISKLFSQNSWLHGFI